MTNFEYFSDLFSSWQPDCIIRNVDLPGCHRVSITDRVHMAATKPEYFITQRSRLDLTTRFQQLPRCFRRSATQRSMAESGGRNRKSKIRDGRHFEIF